ncbi:MAG TPA: sigma 54-interacting transcriptional regulator, partial [Kofleriaceae bacterium]|nr:sigma 54-interacting transcriptional regulator [Kofleriaceae bacterium]
ARRQLSPTSVGAAAVPPSMARLEALVARVAPGNINVLLLGETGVGKEVTAETIHQLSSRRDRPFLCLNCAAFPETLLESELFGHERGAFTGASGAKPGLLETARGGTVLLDEIGEMPLSVQAKLLRVIEDKQVLPLGAVKPRAIDVRFIAATNRDLEAEAARGRFRADLYFRLNGASLLIPPLRSRVDEIRPLAEEFVARACDERGGGRPPALAAEALRWLEAYPWPGNIRELRSMMERAVLLCGGADTITTEHLPVEKMGVRAPPSETRTGEIQALPAAGPLRGALEDEERRKIVAALAAAHGNQARAAGILGIARRTLVRKLAQLGIPRPRKG